MRPSRAAVVVTLVSHRHQFLFLKTKKTGGTSFEMLLEPYCAPEGHEVVHRTTGLVSDEGAVGVRVGRKRIAHLREAGALPMSGNRTADGKPIAYFSHMPAQKVRAAVGDDVWDRYFRVTSVRNPFTRPLSLYHHKVKNRRIVAAPDFANIRSDFSDFVLGDAFDNDYEITHIGRRPVYHDAFRLENRAADIVRLGERLGIPLAAEDMPHAKNLGRDRKDLDVLDLFPGPVIDAIRTKSKWLFDEFDYSPDIDDAEF